MAGVTDKPFRALCRRFGAGMTTSEMTTADTSLWRTAKSRRRLDLDLDAEPVAVQIAGSEPAQLAEAAQACVCRGAQIIDINMGCPAKKVCRKLAGAALLQDEKLVEEILTSVVAAFYYLRIVKLMYFDEPLDAFDQPVGSEISTIVVGAGAVTALFILVLRPVLDGAAIAAATLFAT